MLQQFVTRLGQAGRRRALAHSATRSNQIEKPNGILAINPAMDDVAGRLWVNRRDSSRNRLNFEVRRQAKPDGAVGRKETIRFDENPSAFQKRCRAALATAIQDTPKRSRQPRRLACDFKPRFALVSSKGDPIETLSNRTAIFLNKIWWRLLALGLIDARQQYAKVHCTFTVEAFSKSRDNVIADWDIPPSGNSRRG